MNDEKSLKFKLPRSWIDRIFKRLIEIYGDEFTAVFTDERSVEHEAVRWQSGLFGVSAEEIKHVLELCRVGRIRRPPSVIEFYHYCKGILQPMAPRSTKPFDKNYNPELSRKYIQLIRDKLHGKLADGET